MPKRNRGVDAIFDDATGKSWLLEVHRDEGMLHLGPFTGNNPEDFMILDGAKAKFLGDLLERHSDIQPNYDDGKDVDDDGENGRRDEDTEELGEIADFIVDMGSIDGADHKQWVLDQVLRKLLKDAYEEYVEELEVRDELDWDTGVAP